MAKIPVTDCPAGPALDAAVAKIRGDEEQQEWRCVLEGHWIDGDPETGWCYDCRELVSDGGKVPAPHRPVSQNIATAWELAEELVQKDFDLYIDNRRAPEGSGWDANYRSASQPEWKTIRADKAPLAITRAFLLAHGVTEVGEG